MQIRLWTLTCTNPQGFLEAIMDGIVENERERRIQDGTIATFDENVFARSVIQKVFGLREGETTIDSSSPGS